MLEAAARRFGFALRVIPIDWASGDVYLQHGQMMPNDWKAKPQNHDAIYFGAVGWLASVPDHVSLWGSLLKFRREFDQCNLRPCACSSALPAGRAQAERHGLPGRAREHRRRVHPPGRRDVRRHRARVRDPGVGLLAFRRRARTEVRVLAGPRTPDLGGNASTTAMGEAIAALV